MSRLQRHSTFVFFFSGFVIGLSAGRSWLSFLSIMGGFALSAVGVLVWIPVERRRKMRALRPKAEAMLDAMIALAEKPPQALDKTVIFNGSGRESRGMTDYHLQLRAQDGTIHHLDASTLASGRHAGWIRLGLSTHHEKRETSRCDYLGLVDFAPPEDWLSGRLAKLRALVGNISLYASRQKRLKELGFDIDKEADRTVDPFEPPPAA